MKFKYAKQSKFVIVGTWNTLLGTSLLFVFSQNYFNFHPQIIFALVTLIVLIQSHFIMRKLIWHSKKNYVKEFLKFSTGYVPTYLVNILAIQVFVINYEMPLVAVILVTSIFLVIVTYLFHDKFTFKK